MLTVEAPTNVILTLQSVPPFLVENILALALVLLLAVPLIAHIQLLLESNIKDPTMGASNRRKNHSKQHQENANPTVVMHYPLPVQLDTNSHSELNIQVASMRTTCSTPTVKRSVENLKKDSSKENRNIQLEEQYKHILRKMFLKKQKTCLPLERSSSFLATNAQLPIIDISAFDYDSYRHKLIEMSLKRQYGDRQAPGNVVLNSIHLNAVGSQTGIQLSDKYSHSLFDFIEEYYDATKTLSKKEKEYLHPLDHFLVKGIQKPMTADTGTETKESITELDQVPEMVVFRDGSPIPSATSSTPFGKRLESTKHASKLTIRSRRSSSLPRTPSQSPPTAEICPSSTQRSSVIPSTRQLFNRAENLNSSENRHPNTSVVPTDKPEEQRRVSSKPRTSRSRTPRSAASTTISQSNKTPQSPKVPKVLCKRAFSVEQGKSSNESFAPGGRKLSEYSELISTDRDEKESVTCASASSSETESSFCSSKPREKRFVRSRASSLSSKSRTIKTASQTAQKYINVNPIASISRNQETPKKSTAKSTKPKLCVRPKSTAGRFAWDVPDVPENTSCDEPTEKEKPAPVAAVERPRTANAIPNRRKSPEKGKLSETVLPVLESVLDLEFNLPSDVFSKINADNEKVSNERVKRPASGLRDFKRAPNDKKISSASFVKSPMRPAAVEQEITMEKKISAIQRGTESTAENMVTAVKTSSAIKNTASRPASVSKLPVHIGGDKAKIKKLIDHANRDVSTEKTGHVFEKSFEHLVKTSTSILDKTKRPKTTECVQRRTSSLSPKKELSLEALQLKDSPGITGVFAKKPETPKHQESSKRTITEASKLKTPTRVPSLGGKKISPVPRSSTNKVASSASPQVPSGSPSSNTDSLKKPFLRARSGKYVLTKSDILDKKPKEATNEKTPFSSQQTVDNDEDVKEVLKLPTEDSNAALVMRRELKTYIKNLQNILSNRDKNLQAKDLASLNITEEIIPELRASLSPREFQDLQGLLERIQN